MTLDRRTALGAGAALTLAGVTAGCARDAGPDPDAPPGEVSGTVVHWTYPMGDAGQESWWEPLIAEFNRTWPKVEVQVVAQPWQDRQQSLITAIAGKSAPDVVYLNPGFVPKFASEGVLLPLDDVMESERDDFVGAALKAHTYDGTLYGMPLLMTVANPGYSTKVLKDLGLDQPPVTFDEIREVARLCVKNDLTFAAYPAAIESLNLTFYPFLWSAGGSVLNADGTSAAFHDEAGVRALTLLRELADEGAWDPQSLTQPMAKLEQTKFARGTELMGITMQVPLVEQVLGKGTVRGSAPFSDTDQVVFGSVGALAVFATTKAPEAAAAWAKFVTGPGMERFLRASTYLPPRKSLAGMWEENEDNALKSKWLENVNVGLVVPKALDVMDAVRPHIQACLLGKADPDDALAAAGEQVDALLARA